MGANFMVTFFLGLVIGCLLSLMWKNRRVQLQRRNINTPPHHLSCKDTGTKKDAFALSGVPNIDIESTSPSSDL